MFEEYVRIIFLKCVAILQYIGGSPGEFGFGYNLANLIIFVILQPGLILLFLLFGEKKKERK